MSRFAAIIGILLLACAPAMAVPPVQAGPYTVALVTDPAVVPVGAANAILTVTDAQGKPVTQATVNVLAGMPGMSMGEREVKASEDPATPGRYTARVSFGMAGAYGVKIGISGPQGEGKAVIPLSTGQDSSSGAGIPWRAMVIALAVVVGLVLIVRYRPAPQVLVTLALLGVAIAGAWWAVKNLRRPGAMTPIEAQVMEMNVPAPPGTVPVELGAVERGTVDNRVTYSGQAVGWVEQDVYPRIQGTILEMPVYIGSRVKAGDLVARLDVSQAAPQVAERGAMVSAAEMQASAAEADAEEARAAVNLAESEVGMKESGIAEARANAEAARTQIEDARAQLKAAVADQAYWREERRRSEKLVAQGAFSIEEHQRTVAQAEGADAKVRQAQARVRQVQAQATAADAATRKAVADLHSHHAHEAQTRAAYAARRVRIQAAQAEVARARAQMQAAAAQRGYAEIRAQTDGVVTQRLISPGTLVSPGQAILRIARTRPIRLQANVAVTDLEKTRPGAPVRVWPQDRADSAIDARVTSVQPAVDPVARTGIVEAVVPNAKEQFMPGGYVTMAISTRRIPDALKVPVSALRERPLPHTAPGLAPARHFVWLAEPLEGKRFKTRQVDVERLGGDGGRVAVKGDLKPGQRVVVSGGEYLKDGDEVVDTTPVRPALSNQVTIQVTAQGFEPETVAVKKGVPVRVTFIRKTEETCATDVMFADFDIHKKLPLNQPVVVEFTPEKDGAVVFTCGMKMIKGTVVAQ